MFKKFWVILIPLALLLLILLWWLSRATPTPSPSTCTPDVPVFAGLLNSPPTDITNVPEVIPLGNLNPGGGHVLSVDHMYLAYPVPAGGGSLRYPVHTMAAGKLFALFRQQVPGRPDYDYQIFIKHTCSVYTYFDHLHGLSPTINNYLTSHRVVWQDISGSGVGPWLVFLGQNSGPAMLSLASGEQIGITKNYSHNWDIGLVDTRQTTGTFANPAHYPAMSDMVSAFPVLSDIDLSIYNLGNKMMNAACFIDYMNIGSGLRDAWYAKLASTPKGCGSVGWDTPGHLRGAWFNPSLDSTPLVISGNELAALSIIPDNIRPTTHIQIGFGNTVPGSTVPSLAKLDPSTGTPPVSAPQIANPFKNAIIATAGTVVNPDPAAVGPGVTVCYDLGYGSNFNSMMLHMTDATHLKIKYNPTAYPSAQCGTLIARMPVPDASWIEYVR